MTKIRILLTDDHSLLRAGIRALVDGQPDMEVVGEASTGEEAIEKVRKRGRMAADGLTDREQQIVALISEGQKSKQIAQTLGISLHTLERHRQNLMAKLDFHSRAELIEYAIRKGLFERDA